MSYKKAHHVLPAELLARIQKYIDGEYLYIPRKPHAKKAWGSNTSIRSELACRNKRIYQDYQDGFHPDDLSEKYFLSLKSIQRVILEEKRKNA